MPGAPSFPLGGGMPAGLPMHAPGHPARGLHLEWSPWGRASPMGASPLGPLGAPLSPLGSPLPPTMGQLGPHHPPHHVLPPYAAALPWLAPKRSLLAFSPDGTYKVEVTVQ